MLYSSVIGKSDTPEGVSMVNSLYRDTHIIGHVTTGLQSYDLADHTHFPSSSPPPAGMLHWISGRHICIVYIPVFLERSSSMFWCCTQQPLLRTIMNNSIIIIIANNQLNSTHLSLIIIVIDVVIILFFSTSVLCPWLPYKNAANQLPCILIG